MASLIPQINITEFRKLKVPELKRLKSSEIYSDGEYLFSFCNPKTDYIRIHVENLSQLSNSIGGESLENILNKEVVSA